MPRLLYTIVYTLLMPAILLRLLWRSRLAPAYRQRWLERFGYFPAPAIDRTRPVVWLHAVSVGETLAAVPLVTRLQQEHPDWQWVITTTTPTGSERVRASFGEQVFHVYAPYDLPPLLAGFLQRTQPQLAIVMETELWPSLLHACKQRRIPVIIANARLSEKSARGYRTLAPLTRGMMNDVTLIAAQQQADGARFVQLGLPTEKLAVTGSIKFDLDIDAATQQKAVDLRRHWTGDEKRSVWLAASTHLGEDTIILTAFTALKKQFPDLLLVLVPRHPERFSVVSQQCEAAGFRTVRRSTGTAVTTDIDILVGDTMGELLAFYGAADIAFVGGSLVPVGGHNLIEPAAWGCPVISGPHLFNFAEVERLLRDNNALAIADDATTLAATIQNWLKDSETRQAFGERAKHVADSNRGALARLCALLEILMTK
ncbi:MAG: lipid IV(A) 3-deoxy-D-manno-octulosonic acid transferase [Pseudomonadales bacterium]|nr:lipid IV(A) 3-deoxy-D-manno-octulosonic acid transferase [Pseudomonadales bacterium]